MEEKLGSGFNKWYFPLDLLGGEKIKDLCTNFFAIVALALLSLRASLRSHLVLPYKQ